MAFVPIYDAPGSTRQPVNFGQRLLALMPQSWFSQSAMQTGLAPSINGILASILYGIGVGFSAVYTLLVYTALQLRLATATDAQADLASIDFFSGLLPRQTNESDVSFTTRIRNALVKGGPTAAGISGIVNAVLSVARPGSLVTVWDCQDSPARGQGYGFTASQAPFAVEEYGVPPPDPLTFALGQTFLNGSGGVSGATAQIVVSGIPANNDLVSITITPPVTAGLAPGTITYVVSGADVGSASHLAASLATAIDASIIGISGGGAQPLLTTSTVNSAVVTLKTIDTSALAQYYTINIFVVPASATAGATAQIQISGIPAVGNQISTTITPGIGSGLSAVTVTFNLTAPQAVSTATAATALAAAISASNACVGGNAFVASAIATSNFVVMTLMTGLPALGICSTIGFATGTTIYSPTTLQFFSGTGNTVISPLGLTPFSPGPSGTAGPAFSCLPPVRYFTFALGYGALGFTTGSMVQPFGSQPVAEVACDTNIANLTELSKAAGASPRYFYNWS